MSRYEIITFQDNNFKLDVNVSPSEDTVWLTQEQIGFLFERDKSVIGKHIRNIFKEQELDISTSTAKNAFQVNGQVHYTIFYSLDVIISVGYRVKSKRGILFRKWATSILKNYMLNKTDDCKECKQHIINLQNDVNQIKNSMNHELLIASGDELKGYLSIKRFLETAKKSIYIFDNYFDNSFDDIGYALGCSFKDIGKATSTAIRLNDIELSQILRRI